MESLKIILTNVTKKEFFPLRLTHIKILLFEDSDNINPFAISSSKMLEKERQRSRLRLTAIMLWQCLLEKKISLKQGIYNLTHLITYFGTQITIIVW